MLNALKDEFNAQQERARTDSDKNKMMYKKRGKEQAEFINLFGSINQSGTQLISAHDISNVGGYEEERDLNEAEVMYLKEFEQNDQELENIAGEIVKALDTVKHNAENIEAGVDK